MKKNLFDYFVWIITILFIITIFFLPETVPMHWNTLGEVDRYGSRYEMFIIALLPVIIYYLMHFTKKIDPSYENIMKKEEIYELFRKGLTFYFVIMALSIYLISLNIIQSNAIFFIYPMIGCMFIGMGNYLPKIPQNHFLGIKTPWTIGNNDVWKKTHRIGGHLMVILGICIIILSFVDTSLTVMMTITIALVIALWSYIYSYMLYKKIEKEK